MHPVANPAALLRALVCALQLQEPRDRPLERRSIFAEFDAQQVRKGTIAHSKTDERLDIPDQAVQFMPPTAKTHTTTTGGLAQIWVTCQPFLFYRNVTCLNDDKANVSPHAELQAP